MNFQEFKQRQYDTLGSGDIPGKELIDKLFGQQSLSREEFRELFLIADVKTDDYLFHKARIRQHESFGSKVYLRGLIEFSNYCRCDCLYCGIRKSNRNVQRYHLSKDDILKCADIGHACGFRTIVLQGGEDLSYSDDDICSIVSAIRTKYPDTAVTLSIGERARTSYQKYYDAGAERYLLRHETANPELYAKLHPAAQKLENRIRCLYDLKDIGFQVGAGMMVQSPGQTIDDIITDIFFLKKLQPDMIGCGPFIPHQDTPFRVEPAGSVELTLRLLGILRLVFPEVLLPTTTALGTVDPQGREKGILAGGNVIMPNLSPAEVRDNYKLYDNKIGLSDSAVICTEHMNRQLAAIGYEISVERGDAPRVKRQKSRSK